jgi:hypothetical protein
MERRISMKPSVASTDNEKQLNLVDPSSANVSLRNVGPHLVEDFLKAHTAAINGSVELARDMMMFSRARMQANLDAWVALANCKNVRDLSEWQLALAKKATSQYTEAGSRIITRWAAVMASASPRPEQRSA